MHQLTIEQVIKITNDVENQGINFSHLSTDLIDHVCCEIESQMNQGKSFSESYNMVKENIGIKGLRRIQQDTLMLIDKNYRIMKKSMKMIGVLAMALMAFGALFKIFHWPGASAMLIVSFFFTTLIFFPSLLFVMYKELNQRKQAFIYILTFLGGSAFMTGVLFKVMHWPTAPILFFCGLFLISYVIIPLILTKRLRKAEFNKSLIWLGFIPLMVFLTGILFKIEHWPGASFLLTAGSVFLILVFVPAFYFIEIRKSQKPRIDFLFALIALTYFIVLSFMLQINASQTNEFKPDFQYHSFDKTAIYLLEQNASLLKTIDDKKIKALYETTVILSDNIDELKTTVLQDINKIDRETARKNLLEGKPLLEPYKPMNYLLPNKNPYSPLPDLKKNIQKYLRTYNATADTTLKAINLESIFAIDEKNDTWDWENNQFANQSAVSLLSKLTFWQYQIQLAQNYILINFAQNAKKK